MVSEYVCERSPKKKELTGVIPKKGKNPSIVCFGRARVDNRWATVSLPTQPVFSGGSLIVKTYVGENGENCDR